MKKLIAIILSVFILILNIPTTFAASEITVNFDLTYNGQHTAVVKKGTVITVKYCLENITSAKNFNISSITNEIFFDHEFFEIDEDSITKVHNQFASLQRKSWGEYRVYFNDFSNPAKVYDASQVVGTFKLKVIADAGQSTISSKEMTAFLGSNPYTITSENLTVIVGEEPETTYKVTYINEKNEYKTVYASGEYTVESAPSPAPDGCTFLGWEYDNNVYVPGDKIDVNKDIVLKAKWKKNIVDDGSSSDSALGSTILSKYSLSFETNGGTPIADILGEKDTEIDLSGYTTQKEGYKFDGWYSDKEFKNKADVITLTKDYIVYAKWVESKTEVVTPDYKPDILTDDHYAYIVGREKDKIYPLENLTRAEAATIFFRLLKEETRLEYITNDNTFYDVNSGDWFNTAVSTLANIGIVKGRTAESFVPDEYITRAEFTTIVARLTEASYEGENLFADISKHWACDYINIAASIGWVKGDNGIFRPDDNINRAEVMTLINRVLNRLPQSIEDLDSNMITWTDNSDTDAWYYIAIQEATNSHNYQLKDDGKFEIWTELKEIPDWNSFEN